MPSRKLLLLAVPLLAAGCLAQSKIQSRYDRDHHDCQSEAEHNVDKVLPAGQQVSQNDRNAELLTLFSDCMGKRGWSVAKPKAAGPVTTENSIPPEPSPAAAVLVAPSAARNAPPQPFQQPPRQEPGAYPQQPQPAPGINPGLMAPTQDDGGAATYQPYGSGPGRNF